MHDAARERYRFGGLVLDVAAATLEREGGETIALPMLSFDLLVALVRRAPDVVGVDDLAETVWADAVVGDETVVQRVALLRRALGDDARDPTFVRSVRGRGYQLVPTVERITTARKTLAEAARRRSSVAAVALGGVALVVAAFWAIRSDAPASVDDGPLTRPPAVAELLDRADAYLASQREADNELALELYFRALDQVPEDADALAGASLARSYRTTRFNRPDSEADHAEALARKALAVAPEHARAHRALALALNARGRMAPALEAYARAVELAPDDAASRASAAYLTMVAGRLAEALEHHVTLLDAEDTPTFLDVQLAANLALLGFDEPAAVWFERAVELRPESVFATVELARWHLSRGRPDAADQAAWEAMERSVHRPELVTVRGDVAWLAGDLSAARAAYDAAQAIDPSDGRSRCRRIVLDGDEAAYAAHVAKIRDARAAGNLWPPAAVDEAILHAGFGRDDDALAALDVAVDLGYRDHHAWITDPVLGPLVERRAEDAGRRLGRIRELVEIERQRVLGAPWLPPSLLEVPATPGSDASR